MDYDVLILGGGLIGCSVAYELSKYSLNIALIERDYDIVDDLSLVNSAIVYDGVQCQSNTMRNLQFMGNKIVKDLTSKFNIPYKPCNILFISENEDNWIDNVYEKSIKNEIKNIEVLSKESISNIEPNLNIDFTKGVYSKNTGVICPYELGIAYGEVAFDNGVSFKLEEIVENIEKVNKGFKVTTNKNKFTCRMVINTTPEDYNIDDTIDNRLKEKGYLKYFLIEKGFKNKFNNIVIGSYNNDIIYMHPTVQGCYIAAIKTEEDINYHECYRRIGTVIKDFDVKYINSFYESYFYDDEIIIDDSLVHKGYIKVYGKNYAEVTMTPSIARIIRETVECNLKCKLKSDFNDKRREFYKFNDMTNEERGKLIKLDKRYGKIICSCNNVTEGEIIDSIRRPLGARTLEGIKRRTGAGLGECKSTNCINKIISILARETNKDMIEIVKDSKNSKILLNRIKEFDSI